MEHGDPLYNLYEIVYRFGIYEITYVKNLCRSGFQLRYKRLNFFGLQIQYFGGSHFILASMIFDLI